MFWCVLVSLVCCCVLVISLHSLAHARWPFSHTPSLCVGTVVCRADFPLQVLDSLLDSMNFHFLDIDIALRYANTVASFPSSLCCFRSLSVCVCVCMCVCVCLCTCMCMCVLCACVRVCLCLCLVSMSVFLCIYVYVYYVSSASLLPLCFCFCLYMSACFCFCMSVSPSLHR
jgi:hypothetical protein